MEQQKKQEMENHLLKSEFIPYEEALALKELGFDEKCLTSYRSKTTDQGNEGEFLYSPIPLGDIGFIAFKYSNYNDTYFVSAPIYQQAFRWFREECNLLHIINIDLSDNLKDKVYVYSIEDHLGSIVDRSEEFKTYEEAELACLKKLIEIVNQNKDE